MNRVARRCAIAAVAPLLACGGIVAGPDPRTDPITVFEAAWRDIDRHYAFFEYNDLDWQAVYDTHRPTVTATMGELALRSTLCAIVAEERSFHADLTGSFGSCGHSIPAPPDNYDAALVTAALTGPRQSTGSIEYGRIEADIGYMYIGSFQGQFQDHFERVLAELDGIEALVIDIRNNGGGNDGNARSIASRLISERRVYQLTRYRNGPGHGDFTPLIEKTIEPEGSRRFDGPVALITNRLNGSAAEDFTTMMLAVPTAFTVGDTTIGNSSNPLLRELPNGWLLRIPQSMQMTPGGFIIEGRGLPPTYPVQLDPADVARGVDTILETARQELRKRI